LKSRYGVRHFSFLHDHFLFNREKVKEFCRILTRRKLNIDWNCSSRPDNVDPELLEFMVKSGCRGLYFGIESGSQRIQKSIRKNIDVSTLPGIIEECEKYNMLIVCSFIIGFPEEREEDINATLRLALKCSLFKKCFVQLHLLAPMPGTQLFDRCKDRLIYKGLFSDVADERIARLKENVDLIKRYPHIFCVYYGIKSRHIFFNSIYNIVNVFLVIFAAYRLSCRIILDESGYNPTDLFREIYKKLSKGKDKNNFAVPKSEIKKNFPDSIDYIYKRERLNAGFIKSIIKFEIRKYKEYKQKLIQRKKEMSTGVSGKKGGVQPWVREKSVRGPKVKRSIKSRNCGI